MGIHYSPRLDQAYIAIASTHYTYYIDSVNDFLFLEIFHWSTSIHEIKQTKLKFYI